MERTAGTSYRHRPTNENADSLRHKVQKLSDSSAPVQRETRRALGEVSTNTNRLSSNNSTKLPQRVYVRSDENDVPNRPPQREADSARRPLVEIGSSRLSHAHLAEYESQEATDVYELEEDEDDLTEIDENEHLPAAMMPTFNRAVLQELQQVYKLHNRETLDRDDEDAADVSMVAEYSPEIFNFMHSLEIKYRPNPRYMEIQTEIKWTMRSVLVDWLVQVHSRFNLLPETLFLTINYMDRFLSKRPVSLTKFQLCGAVALFVAAKYEEINCPSVQEIAYMVDNAYSVEDLLRAERFMIDVLEFEMGWPGPMSFLRRTSKADDYDFETRTLAKYFLEITVMDYRFVGSPPSWLAAGAHYLSRIVLGHGEWTTRHVFYSGYTKDQLKPLARVLIEACHNPLDHHKSIFEKYQERRFRRASTYVQEWLKSNGF
ncbi:hypothetical protein WICPIJ_000877 [Wickerhamomyces pijperi]|uniref:Cyclin N-terminal domain-containing protein n=1 Tax=Wickerhamomyces pijperi TaxID=599730 RepID=A0A9P8QCU7_WICPI|nr:hypothetical protein WICPIJ_000877 [Wickerhamomyces pijperi]